MARAPPSGRSSRLTMVTCACFRPIFITEAATRIGSRISTASGRPVPTAQKRQRRVQMSPRIMKLRRAVRPPALVQVRTARLFADGVQPLFTHELLDADVALRGVQPDLEPRRLAPGDLASLPCRLFLQLELADADAPRDCPREAAEASAGEALPDGDRRRSLIAHAGNSRVEGGSCPGTGRPFRPRRAPRRRTRRPPRSCSPRSRAPER